MEQAQAEGRDLTTDEQATVDQALARVKAMDRERAEARASKSSALFRQVMSLGTAEDDADTEPGPRRSPRRLRRA